MKLHKFVADSNHKAIQMVHDALGPDALVYSTRTVPEGVEIVAAVSYGDSIQEISENIQEPVESEAASTVSIDEMTDRLQKMDQTVTSLSQHINSRFLDGFYLSDDERSIQRKYLYYYLGKLGFRGKFCQQFVESFLRHHASRTPITDASIQVALSRRISTAPYELIDDKNICAFVGTHGAGKTATITKLMRRYVDKYGAESIGVITADPQAVNMTNQLIHYCNLDQVDLEFATEARELSRALHAMRRKNLILIDTPGMSQRDAIQLTRLHEFLESQGDLIKTYLVLASNVQEIILDETVRAFQSPNLKGCIFTKRDESVSLAPALSASLNYQLDVHYICHGTQLKSLTAAKEIAILQQVLHESMAEKQIAEQYLYENVERVTKKIKEGFYDG